MLQRLPQMDILKTKKIANDVYRYAYNSDSRVSEKLIEFYQEGVKNPSVAKMIASHATISGCKRYGDMMQEDLGCLRGKPGELLKNYIKKSILALVNIEKYKKEDSVKEFYEQFEKVFKVDLYPTTHKIRQAIINEGRVVYDRIIPKKNKSLKTIIKYSKLFRMM